MARGAQDVPGVQARRAGGRRRRSDGARGGLRACYFSLHEKLLSSTVVVRATSRTRCTYSADNRARILKTHRTPCMYGADDRARRMQTHRTPCTELADDRARRMQPHRTPCTESADDRARRLMPHRTPCTESADDRADKRGTPCSSSGTSPRARTAPLWEGLSSASCPSCSTPPSMYPCSLHRRHPERVS